MDDAPADESPAHIFKDLPQVNMTVTQQHNGVDCGLYMLKYIELIARHQPEIKAPKSRRTALDICDYPALRFSSGDIDRFRVTMLTTIEEQAAAQRCGRHSTQPTAAVSRVEIAECAFELRMGRM